MNEEEAAEAMLALGPTLSWEEDANNWRARTDGLHNWYNISPLNRPGEYRVAVSILGKDGACGFDVGTVHQAKAICEYYCQTGDWNAVLRHKAHSDAQDKLIWFADAPGHEVADSGHTLYVIFRQSEVGGKVGYKAYHSRVAWERRRKQGYFDELATSALKAKPCPGSFDDIAAARAACEWHLIHGVWTKES